jgi:hypothetical protein
VNYKRWPTFTGKDRPEAKETFEEDELINN